jgi:hypothetical protein
MACAEHPNLAANLSQNRERIIRLEMEVEHMNEKLDTVLKKVDDLKEWQLKITIGTGLVVGAISLALAHGPKLLHLLGVGAG